MRVELENMDSGRTITEVFVTKVRVRDGYIEMEYDKRIRPTMVSKKLPASSYEIKYIRESEK